MVVYVGLNIQKLVLGTGDTLMSEVFLQRHEDLENNDILWKDL
jgi:hypothetical protein